MSLVVDSISIEGTLVLNGIDVTNDVQSVGEKVANAGGVVSYESGLYSVRPASGVVGRFYHSIDQGIVSKDDGTDWNNVLPAYAGDVTSTVGGTTLTLATVNSTVGTFGTTFAVPAITVNGKGLITNISTVNLTSASVGLGNVDNTSDANKPISTATQTALNDKVDKVAGKGLSTNDFTNADKSAVTISKDITNYTAMSGVTSGGDITLTTGVDFTVGAGDGFVRDSSGANIIHITWSVLSGTVPVAGDNFIYIDYTGTLVYRTIKNDADNIFVGYITTNNDNTAVLGFNNNKFSYDHYFAHLNKFVENAMGTLVEGGFEVSTQPIPDTLKVNVSAGTLWEDFNEFNVGPLSNFRKFFRDNAGVYYEDTTNANYMNNSSYNDVSLSGTSALVPMTAGYYKKDLLFVSTSGNLCYQYGTSQSIEIEHAYDAPAPIVSPASTNVVVIAHVIIQEGNPVPIAIIDMRASFSRLWDGHYFTDLVPTIGHHLIQGLDADDHLQYHTDARGDTRYYTKTQLDAGQLNNQYYTESEIDGFLSGKSNTSHVHAEASGSAAGFMSSSDFTKLSGIETGATANSSDATLLSRANHTGTQDASTITGLSKTSVGLGNVDNTSDVNKPISTATQTALNDKVDKVTGKGLSTNDFTDFYESEVDMSTFMASELGSSVNVSGGVISLTGGVNFSIAPGVGYTRNNLGKMIRVTWSTLTGTCTFSGDNFINVDYLGNIVITTGAAQGDLVALGYIRTGFANTTVVGFSNTRLSGNNFTFNMGELFRTSIGSLVQSGCNTAMQASPNQLKITVGSGYIWSLFNRFTFTDTSTFTKLINTSDYGFIPETSTTANTVNTAYWNDATQPAVSALTAMTTNYYKKDLIALTPEGTVFYVYANAEWATLDEARAAPTPSVPESIKLSIIRSAAIVVKQGQTSIEELIDIRPMLSRLFDTGQAATNATVISHSNLTDLLNDDHTQYLNTTRGDSRYYRKTELDAGSLDTRYYTESEITSFLSGKANSSHNHVSADITDLSATTVGLGNVPNVDATNATNISSGTLANARLTANLTEIGNLTKSNGDIISVVAGSYVARTLSQYKTDLSLNNVANVDTTNATNISSGTLANARLTTNLSQLGGITFATNDVMQYNGTTLVNVSMNSLKASLSLAKGDVGLGNVANVDTTNATNISSGTLANARLTTNLSQIGNLTLSAGDFLQYTGGVMTNVTPAALKTSLSLAKGDVGLGNVANIDTTNASNISSGTLANARLTTNLSQLGGITFSTNDFIQYNGTTLVTVTPTQVKTALSLTKSDVGLSNVANVDTTNASNITTGTLPLSVIPAGALERLVVVADQTARFALTTATVQNGDTVKQNDTGVMYFVQDDTNLGNSLGYELYRAGAATSVPYSGITSLPSNISQLGSATFSTNDIAYYNGTVVTNISPTSYKALLSLTKSDVGLSNVVNSLQVINAGNGVSFASGNTASRPVAGTNGRLYASTDSGIFLDNGTSWVVQQTAITGDISISANSTTATLATVNSNVGTFNNVTVNAKGLVTAASNVSYLTGNQSITLSGDVSGTGTTAITVTLPTINLNVGTFNNVVVNGKGQVTAASNVSYLTANQTITASGDVTGSGTTGIALTLATVNSNVGTFGSTSAVPVITVNGKGLVTAVSTAALTSSSVGLGNVTNSLQVINAGGAVSHASGTNASKPTVGTSGRFYSSTDQGITYFDNGTTWSAQLPAYTGDVTSALGGTALTLATVNSNIGTFNNVTVNAKGLVTAASNANYLVDSAANGILARTALNTTTARTITGTANQITVTDGNGVAGNPIILLADNPVLPGTGSVALPIGTTAQRDSAAINGKLRWNSDILQVEVSDTNVYRVLGKIAQFITGDIVQTTGTTILPYDATIPLNTEGFQIWTQTITPTYTNSTIVVIFNIFSESSGATRIQTVALFNGTTAISTASAYTGVVNTPMCLGINKTFSPGSVTPITLSARVGPSAAATVYVNRGNTETFGGTTNTSYIIMEII